MRLTRLRRRPGFDLFETAHEPWKDAIIDVVGPDSVPGVMRNVAHGFSPLRPVSSALRTRGGSPPYLSASTHPYLWRTNLN